MHAFRGVAAVAAQQDVRLVVPRGVGIHHVEGDVAQPLVRALSVEAVAVVQGVDHVARHPIRLPAKAGDGRRYLAGDVGDVLVDAAGVQVDCTGDLGCDFDLKLIGVI